MPSLIERRKAAGRRYNFTLSPMHLNFPCFLVGLSGTGVARAYFHRPSGSQQQPPRLALLSNLKGGAAPEKCIWIVDLSCAHCVVVAARFSRTLYEYQGRLFLLH